LQSELIELRRHILGFNQGYISNLQLYTFILIGCRQFLREDEIAGLGFHSIVPEVTVVKNGVLVQLGITIKGKSDKDVVVCIMHRDDSVPALCPIRHLLLLIALGGMTDGYFFRKSLDDPNIPVSYDTMLSA
jgi:hypothetical protein